LKISIVTATFNSVKTIGVLAESLRSQVDKDFEWVVADGGSNDGTLDYLRTIDDLELKIIQGPDFGIYDALNKALNESCCENYIVIGSDDYFYPCAVSEYKSILEKYDGVDLVTCPVKYNGLVIKPKKKWPFLYGQFSFISMHSVGLLIRKKLHKEYGFYSKKYPIAADQYFILKAILNGATIENGSAVVGVHGSDGVSGVDNRGVITEFYRVQVDVGFNNFVQTSLCCMRLMKNLLV
jgi:glycosyltransferase